MVDFRRIQAAMSDFQRHIVATHGWDLMDPAARPCVLRGYDGLNRMVDIRLHEECGPCWGVLRRLETAGLLIELRLPTDA